MSANSPANAELWGRIEAFVAAGLYGEVTESQLSEFEQLLRGSEEAQVLFAELIEMSVLLPARLRELRAGGTMTMPKTRLAGGPLARPRPAPRSPFTILRLPLRPFSPRLPLPSSASSAAPTTV